MKIIVSCISSVTLAYFDFLQLQVGTWNSSTLTSSVVSSSSSSPCPYVHFRIKDLAVVPLLESREITTKSAEINSKEADAASEDIQTMTFRLLESRENHKNIHLLVEGHSELTNPTFSADKLSVIAETGETIPLL
jgi:hypothetical protein